jgi:peptidyl-prolyl cis-trans isomerase C
MTSPKLLAQASLLALMAAWPALAQEAATEEAAPDAAADPVDDAAAATAEAADEAAAATADAAGDAAAATTEAVDDAAVTAQAADDAAAAVQEATDAATAAGDAAADAATPPAEPVTRDTVVATVNGTDITLGEVIIAASQLPAQYQQLPPDILFAGVTDQLVQQELLAETMTGEVPARVEIALANQRRSLLAGEVISGIMEGAVTDEAVQAAYDAQYANAEPVQEWNASHILVATEEEAKAVEDRLAAGEDFAAVAQEVSTDTGSGAQGGELGWFSPGMMVPEFETGVSALEPGQVSAPIESQFGWHVIKLNETRDQPAPALEEVRGEIESQVRDAAIQARLAELQAAGEVTQPAPGQFDPAVLGDLSLLED